MRLKLLSFFVGVLTLPAAAQVIPRAESSTTPARHGADSVVPYVQNGTPQQQLSLFFPKRVTRTPRFTTIVFTYGGGWQAPRGPNVDRICEAFRDMGFGCALVAHRLGGTYRYPAQAEDVAAAAAWVMHHVAELGGDPQRVVLVGHSSGAHLSAIIALDASYLGRYGARPTDFAGVVGLSTPT